MTFAVAADRSTEFRSVDDLVRTYVRLGVQRGLVKAQQIAQSEGERCAKCGGGPSTAKSNGARLLRHRKWKTECASCGAPWRGEEINVVRSASRKRKHGHAAAKDGAVVDRFDVWRRLQPMVENRPRHVDQQRWDFALVCLIAHLDRTIGTLPNVVDHGPDILPTAHWTIGRVRGGILLARDTITKRALRAGLIPMPPGGV